MRPKEWIAILVLLSNFQAMLSVRCALMRPVFGRACFSPIRFTGSEVAIWLFSCSLNPKFCLQLRKAARLCRQFHAGPPTGVPVSVSSRGEGGTDLWVEFGLQNNTNWSDPLRWKEIKFFAKNPSENGSLIIFHPSLVFWYPFAHLILKVDFANFG